MATWFVRRPKESKYGARKITTDDGTFDSLKEYRRFCELRILEKAGEIEDLKRQVSFELIPKQVACGRVVERAIEYVADFTYHRDGEYIVEDVKGYKAGGAYSVFVMKRKLMLWMHGIKVREV